MVNGGDDRVVVCRVVARLRQVGFAVVRLCVVVLRDGRNELVAELVRQANELCCGFAYPTAFVLVVSFRDGVREAAGTFVGLMLYLYPITFVSGFNRYNFGYFRCLCVHSLRLDVISDRFAVGFLNEGGREGRPCRKDARCLPRCAAPCIPCPPYVLRYGSSAGQLVVSYTASSFSFGKWSMYPYQSVVLVLFMSCQGPTPRSFERLDAVGSGFFHSGLL